MKVKISKLAGHSTVTAIFLVNTPRGPKIIMDRHSMIFADFCFIILYSSHSYVQ